MVTPMVGHNLEGQKYIGTSIGCIFSVFFTSVVIIYAIIKGRVCVQKLLNNSNYEILRPLVTTTILENQKTKTIYDLTDFQFMFAFGQAKLYVILEI